MARWSASLLETIREYGLECLMVAGEAEAIRWRHAQCMLALAEEVRPKIHGPEQGEWLERLEQEHDNLRGAGLVHRDRRSGVRAFGRSGSTRTA